MKTLCIDQVLSFYRKTHANYVLLFHVDSYYVAYNNDATVLNELLNNGSTEIVDNHIQFKFPDKDLANVIQLFAQRTIPVKWIEYRDDNGNFVLPKVKQILADLEDDY